MSWEDKTIEDLLDLDNIRYLIDENLGLWVKFEVKRIHPSPGIPHGIKYSLTLHDRSNARIMGFDNAHAIKKGDIKSVPNDHWHRSDKARPYCYKNAVKLIEDFWREVDKEQKKLEEILSEP